MTSADSPAGNERGWFLAALLFVSLLPVVTLTAAYLFAPAGLGDFNFAMAFVATGFHVALTSFFYLEPELGELRREHPIRFVWVPVSLCVGTAALLASEAVPLPWILSGYFSWQLYHFQRQNVGVLAFVSNCLRVARMTRFENAAIELAAFAGIAGYLSLDSIPAKLLGELAGPVCQLALTAQVLAVVIAAAAWVLRVRTEGWSWFSPWHVLGSLFFAGSFLIQDFGVAFGTYAYAHGLQYVVFMYLLSLSRGRTVAWLSPLSLTAIALAGAMLLVATSNRVMFNWSRDAVFGLYLGLVMSHFVVDAIVWRMSQPTQRGYVRRGFAFVWD